MSVPVQSFLKRRRDRAVGSILGYAENQVYGHLSEQQAQALRRVVIDALNSYHDSVLDLMKAEVGIVRNEEVLAALERVEGALHAAAVRTRVDSGTPAADDPSVERVRAEVRA